MKYLLLILIFSPWIIHSQNLIVKGKVLNFVDHQPIPMVHVGLDSIQNSFAATNNQGEFVFNAKLQRGQKIILSHTSFETLEFEVTRGLLSDIVADTLDLGVLELQIGNKIFGVIEVSSEKLPETVFGSEKFSVEDFEIIDKDRILMLVYEKTLKRSSELVLADNDQNELGSVFVPGKAIELVHDFRNEVYLKTELDIFHVEVDQNDQIRLDKLDMKKFKEQLEPIKDSLYEDVYFSDFSELYPKFSYFEFDREDSAYVQIRSIIDQVMMDMYRAEFKYVNVRTKIWAHNLQNETGIDKEDIIGAAVFTKSIYYDPLYAPMYIKSDTVFIFDFYKDYMYKFVSENGLQDSVGIYFHHKPKKGGWQNMMTQDLDNDEIYGVFDKHGYSFIKPINLITGATDGVFKLYYRYVEKIIVKGNYVYYTYRPFESRRKKYIYREKIPNEVLIKKSFLDITRNE